MSFALAAAVANATKVQAYSVGKSLRTRSGNSAQLSRTPAGAPTNAKIFTHSRWMKRGALGVRATIFAVGTLGSDTATVLCEFDASDRLYIGGGVTSWRVSTAVFRDPTAHMNIVVAVDTTQATANNRIRVYVNGSEITSWSTLNNPALNSDLAWHSVATNYIGYNPAFGGNYCDAVHSEINDIDGQQLDGSYFGAISATSGEWVPKKYTGTYGANGFYLDFSDPSAATAAAIGADRSGNGNNWTPSGISVASDYTRDASLDTPTNNCMVLNALGKDSSFTVTEGNCRATINTTASAGICPATFALPKTGKWYFEITNIAASPYLASVGLMDANVVKDYRGMGSYNASVSDAVYAALWSTYGPYNGISTSNFSEFHNVNGPLWSAAAAAPPSGAGDVLMVAYDADNGKLWMGKNGTWWNTSGTANPATGTDPHWSSIPSAFLVPLVHGYYTTYADLAVNFGHRAFAYTPPTGFKAPTPQNIPAATIKKPKSYFNSVTYTGTGSAKSVTGVGFQPDLVWIKRRDSAASHNLFDSVRGVRIHLSSDLAAAEVSEGAGVSLTSFDADGFSLGTDNVGAGQVNANAGTFVAWCWKKSATPGLDIVAYTGNGANRTIAHALGVAPSLMLIKGRSGATDWTVYHKSVGNGSKLILDTTAASAADATAWNSASPDASNFALGTQASVNTNTATYIAYLFAEVAGFSRFGSYQGNGSSDGPFVYCGFRPAFVLIKRTDTIGSWYLIDAVRGIANPIDETGFGDALIAEGSAAESGVSCPAIDFTATGFKLRDTIADFNGSANTFVFAAFAEMPSQTPAAAR